MNPRKRHNNSFRRVSWLAMLALLLQVLLPAIHQPGLAFAAQPPLVDGVDLKDICFAPGTAPAAPADSDKSADHHMPPCAVCQAMHAAGGLVPPTAFTVVERPLDTASFVLAQDAAFAPSQAYSPAQARAPPAST